MSKVNVEIELIDGTIVKVNGAKYIQDRDYWILKYSTDKDGRVDLFSSRLSSFDGAVKELAKLLNTQGRVTGK